MSVLNSMPVSVSPNAGRLMLWKRKKVSPSLVGHWNRADVPGYIAKYLCPGAYGMQLREFNLDPSLDVESEALEEISFTRVGVARFFELRNRDA